MTLSNHSAPRLFSFLGGAEGQWIVEQVESIAGESLPVTSRIAVVSEPNASLHPSAVWSLRGITSNERYVVREEKSALVARQEGLGRPTSTRAALIPIRKSAEWWALPQDERRHIFEAQSRHIAIGMKYLPAIARRLHHCRDLGPNEPFDFLTWFEYAPSEEAMFNELVAALRSSPEWEFVVHEVDIRLRAVV